MQQSHNQNNQHNPGADAGAGNEQNNIMDVEDKNEGQNTHYPRKLTRNLDNIII